MRFRFDIEGTADRSLLGITGELEDLPGFFERKFSDFPATIMAVKVTTGRTISHSLFAGLPKQERPKKPDQASIRFKIEMEGICEDSLRGVMGWEDQTGPDLFGIFRSRLSELPISIHAVQVTIGGFIRNSILSGFPEHEELLEKEPDYPAPVKFMAAT